MQLRTILETSETLRTVNAGWMYACTLNGGRCKRTCKGLVAIYLKGGAHPSHREHRCMPDPAGHLCGCPNTAVHDICVQDIQGRHKTCHVHGHRRDFQHAVGQAGCQWDGPRHPRTNQPLPRHHICLDLKMSRPPPDKAPFLIVWLTAACKHRLPCLP